jgi:hypothetical protein
MHPLSSSRTSAFEALAVLCVVSAIVVATVLALRLVFPGVVEFCSGVRQLTTLWP